MDERIRLSRLQERRGMKRLGGTQHGGSGNGWKRKNDGHTVTELVEFKRTSKRQISIKIDDLTSLEQRALLEGRVPILGFELGGRHYFVLTEDDYEEMTGR